ncbi:MAG: ribosome small subunit-dependent GTPase A [Armatimonadota bacterium]|nr:ribosome small subunit-dependent GTPase A [Armatimonadota bacterium]MDW8025410.1 ribosome small subunit-dependent GTPase A [Armatimonadota bacterium]
MRGLVVARSGARIEIWLPEQRRIALGIPRGKLQKHGERIYAGDWVDVRIISPNEVAIEGVEERANLLTQPPVANVDKMLLVMSWHEPDFSNLVLDGLLAQAEFLNLAATIVINKVDLALKRELPRLERWGKLYESLGYPVLKASIKTGDGLSQLREVMRGNLVVLAGPSGSGKSSILNALIPGAKLRTGEVSEKLGRGRHSTTEVRLLPNPNGGWVVDTPGFQRVDLPSWVNTDTLPKLYREFTNYQCEFNNCTHTVEPGCAVKEALKHGEIPKERYQTYLFWRDAIRRVERERKK